MQNGTDMVMADDTNSRPMAPTYFKENTKTKLIKYYKNYYCLFVKGKQYCKATLGTESSTREIKELQLSNNKDD